MPDPSLDPLAEFLAHCPAMLFVADPGAVILRRSESLGRALGAGAEVGAKLLDSLHPADVGAFQAVWSRLIEGGGPMEFELRLQAADGGYQAVSMSAQR